MFADGPKRCIPTGEEIGENIINDILRLSKLGDMQFCQFVEERLVKGIATFFDVI